MQDADLMFPISVVNASDIIYEACYNFSSTLKFSFQTLFRLSKYFHTVELIFTPSLFVILMSSGNISDRKSKSGPCFKLEATQKSPPIRFKTHNTSTRFRKEFWKVPANGRPTTGGPKTISSIHQVSNTFYREPSAEN